MTLWLHAGETGKTGLRLLDLIEIPPLGPIWYGCEEDAEPESSTTSGLDRPDTGWQRQAAVEIARVFTEEARDGQIDPAILALCAQGSEELNRIVPR